MCMDAQYLENKTIALAQCDEVSKPTTNSALGMPALAFAVAFSSFDDSFEAVLESAIVALNIRKLRKKLRLHASRDCVFVTCLGSCT